MLSGHSLALEIVLVLTLSVFEFATPDLHCECLSRQPISWLFRHFILDQSMTNTVNRETANMLIIPITAQKLNLVFTSLIYWFNLHCFTSYILANYRID